MWSSWTMSIRRRRRTEANSAVYNPRPDCGCPELVSLPASLARQVNAIQFRKIVDKFRGIRGMGSGRSLVLHRSRTAQEELEDGYLKCFQKLYGGVVTAW